MQKVSEVVGQHVAEIRRAKSLIGQMPARPPSIRGWAGSWPVRLVRRSLFWVWPPLRESLDAVCLALDGMMGAIEGLESRVSSFESDFASAETTPSETTYDETERAALDRTHADLWLEVARLRAEVEELRSASNGASRPVPAIAGTGPLTEGQ